MSTPFSHFFQKINQISPLESNFTEVLSTIALKPKTLYFYGKLPKNVSEMTAPPDASSAENPPQPAVSTSQSTTPLSQSTISTPQFVVSAPQFVVPTPQSATLAPQSVALPHRSVATTRPKCVAVVGARHNTKYGEEVAYKLAYELARRGVIIISGLAYGIDSIAHRACLDAGGTTIAVLGTPIDKIYPTRHLKLAVEILEKGGAIISEYPPAGVYSGARLSGPAGEIVISPQSRLDAEQFPLAPGESFSKAGERLMEHKAAFLYRNRLISGLSDAVIVAEAASHSGSLNTASHALEQGKEVFAVPGNITNPYSQGCNRLIAQGATPVTCTDDVLRELFPAEFFETQRRLSQRRLFGDTPEETAILQSLGKGCRSGEEIMRNAVLPPELFNQAITMLELKSRVRPLGANHWALT